MFIRTYYHHEIFSASLRDGEYRIVYPEKGVIFRPETSTNSYEAVTKQLRSRYEAEFEQIYELARRRLPTLEEGVGSRD